MKYSKGIFWLDDTRIPFVDKTEMEGVCKSDKTKKTYNEWLFSKVKHKRSGGNTQGRFTPNLLVSDDALNDGTVSKTNTKGQIRSEKRNWVYTGENKNNKMNNISDKGSNSRYYDIDLWFNNLILNLVD